MEGLRERRRQRQRGGKPVSARTFQILYLVKKKGQRTQILRGDFAEGMNAKLV